MVRKSMMREEEEVCETTALKVPAWLHSLFSETFFVACAFHQNCRKNEKNIFCLHCCQSFCPHCIPSHHPSHPLIQVRRYVYQDVIRLDDLEKIVDCSGIQPYTINGAKVIFLHQRAQSKSCKLGSGNACFTCDRILQDPFNFCSLSCKVDHTLYHEEDVSSILYTLDGSGFSISQFEGLRVDIGSDFLADDGQSTPNSIYEDSLIEYGAPSYRGSSGGSANMEDPGIVRRNARKKGGFLPGIMLSLSSRRKGAPHRSPLS